MAAHAYVTEPYSYAEARTLAEGLGVSEPIAVTLVRRGYRTLEEARRFLDADETHGPLEFDAMAEVVDLLLAAGRDGRRITVHGDYDVDGVCATTILVAALRDLGASCDWYIPDRLGEGYGLSVAGVRALADRGTEVLLTADCGITCAAEVREAQAAGMQVVVTDHHSPPEQLPECLILHPSLSGYPFAELCGTGVAYKLACALRASGATSGEGADEADLDLVALATVADVVPLLGENRSLVRRGLVVGRRARRPGMRALIAASGSEAERLDEGDLAFRLGPRINAAGRLYRADAGVELFLADDPGRAEEIASELDRINRERQLAEREVEAAAEAALRELPEQLRDAPALVIAGQGWHPGVVGIVASRLVERHWRPVILLSFEGESGRGSGRSIPGFDLLGGLEACSEHLVRFGGHRAAAGLEISASELEPFRAAFIAHAAESLGPETLIRSDRIDALVGGDGLGLELAEELERLAPFGAGNPGVRLLVPSALLGDVSSMGDGKHSRFTLRSGGARALGVAFGRSSLPVSNKQPVDAAVRLEVNQWNGSVEPRVVLNELYELSEGSAAEPLHRCACGAEEWWSRFDAELTAPYDTWPDPALAEAARAGSEREAVRGRRSAVATMAELVSSGESVLAVCADASRRAELAGGAAGLSRFGAGAALIRCGRCGADSIAELVARGEMGLALTDYEALAMAPGTALGFDHVVLVDPPPFPHLAALAARGPGDRTGYMHSAWGEQERGFALRVLDHELGMRQPLRNLFRALCKADSGRRDSLREALSSGGEHPQGPELAARCVRVLRELELITMDARGHAWAPRVVSSEHTQLQRSAAFRAYSARLEEGKKYLASLRQQ